MESSGSCSKLRHVEKPGKNYWKQSVDKWGRNSIKDLKSDVEA